MQRKIIAAAVGAALGGIAAPAFAIVPSSYDPATALDVFWSGATATENQIQAYHRLICKAGTSTADRMDIVRATNQFVFFCRTKTNAELTAAGVAISLPASFENRIIAVRKTSVGGSGNGVVPVRNQLGTMPFMNFSSVAPVAAASCSSSVVAAAGAQVSYVLWTCPTAFGVSSPFTAPSNTNTALERAQTQGGCSDLEPALFGGADNLDNITSTNNVVYGVPVTRVTYRALQVAQGKNGTDHSDWNCTQDAAWNITAAAGTDSRGPRSDCEKDMPSISRAVARGLYSGNLFEWSQLGLSPTDPNVYIARRVDSSGTQRSAEVFHFNARCDASIPLMVAGNDGGTCGAAGTVNEGSGSQNVTNCLNTHNTAGRFAIGILSTEFNTVSCANAKASLTGTAADAGAAFAGTQAACGSASAGTSGEQGAQFRFVKIDGKAPTLLNAANGKYEFQYESSCQTAAVAQPQPPYTGGDTAASKEWLAFAYPQLNLPDVIADINVAFRQSFGDSGLLAIPTFVVTPSTPFPYTVAGLRARPVGSSSRQVAAGLPNSCAFPTPFFEIPANGN